MSRKGVLNKLRFYVSKVFHAFGYCPNCKSDLNRTRSGHLICNGCGDKWL